MDKKEAILNSVLKLVKRDGFYHLNMKNIAEEAGVAAGTIYLYFKGKEDIINALYKMILTNFNEAVLKSYNESRSLKDNFYAMLNSAIQFYLNKKDQFSFIEQYTYAPFLFKENQDENFMLLLPIYKMMKTGKKQKAIKNLPDAVLLSLIHGPMNTILKLHLAHKTDLNKKGIREPFYDACWEAVSTERSISLKQAI